MSRFSLCLIQIKNMMCRGDEWLQLNSPRELAEIALKLPYNLRRSWADIVNFSRRKNKFASFQDLSDLVAREAELLACPGISSLLAGKSLQQPTSKIASKMLATRTFNQTQEYLEESSAVSTIGTSTDLDEHEGYNASEVVIRLGQRSLQNCCYSKTPE